jgi:hypothetical protein
VKYLTPFLVLSVMWTIIIIDDKTQDKIDISIDQCRTAFEECNKAKIEPVPCRSSLQVDREGNLFFRGYDSLAYGFDGGVRFCPCPIEGEDKP